MEQTDRCTAVQANVPTRRAEKDKKQSSDLSSKKIMQRRAEGSARHQYNMHGGLSRVVSVLLSHLPVPVANPHEAYLQAGQRIIEAARRYRSAGSYTFCGKESSQPVITVSKEAVNRHTHLRKYVRNAYATAPLDKDVVVRFWVRGVVVAKVMVYLEEHKKDRTLHLEPCLYTFDEESVSDLRNGGIPTEALEYDIKSFCRMHKLVGSPLLILKTKRFRHVQRSLARKLYREQVSRVGKEAKNMLQGTKPDNSTSQTVIGRLQNHVKCLKTPSAKSGTSTDGRKSRKSKPEKSKLFQELRDVPRKVEDLQTAQNPLSFGDIPVKVEELQNCQTHLPKHADEVQQRTGTVSLRLCRMPDMVNDFYEIEGSFLSSVLIVLLRALIVFIVELFAYRQ